MGSLKAFLGIAYSNLIYIKQVCCMKLRENSHFKSKIVYKASINASIFQPFLYEKGGLDQDFDAGVDRRNVILIRNGKKSYGSGKNRKEVLKDINMTITEGAM